MFEPQFNPRDELIDEVNRLKRERAELFSNVEALINRLKDNDLNFHETVANLLSRGMGGATLALYDDLISLLDPSVREVLFTKFPDTKIDQYKAAGGRFS